MSFQINWNQLASDAALNESIRSFLHTELNAISLPSFIDNLSVAGFSLGEVAPEITIRHIGDPFDEFYADHTTDDEEKNHALPPSSPSLNSDSDSSEEDEQSLTLPTNEKLPLPHRKGSDLFRHFTNYNMNALGLGQPELDPPAAIFPHRLQPAPLGRGKSRERNANDIQFILEVDFQSQIAIDISINLLVNYPLKHFISLPIKLRITDLAIHSLAAVAYLENKVFVSILCDLNDSAADYFSAAKTTPESRDSAFGTQNTPAGGNFVDYSAASTRERIDVIRSINIDTEIGEVENNVLRNVGKVEKFLVEQLRTLIRDEICWPGWLCFDLASDEKEEEEE